MKGVQQHTVSAVDPSSGNGLQQLRLPTNIAESFADDLIREFDNRRSQLQLDMLRAQRAQSSQQSTSQLYSSSIISPGFFSPPVCPVMESTSQDQRSIRSRDRSYSSGDVRSSNATQPNGTRTIIENRRRKSAGELLRRSSAYLRQKLQLFKTVGPGSTRSEPFRYSQRLSKSQPEGIQTADTTLTQNIRPKKSMETVRSLFNSWRSYRKPQHQHVREIFELNDDDLTTPPVPPLPPSKIATNTTISISHLTASVTQLSKKSATTTRLPPPIIRQYPPRPLVYSAVDLPLRSNSQREEPAHVLKSRYRQSMPVLPRDGLEPVADRTHRRRRSSDPEVPTAATPIGHFEKSARRLSRVLGCNTLVKRASTSFRKKVNKVKRRRSINDVFRSPEQQVEVLVA
ncbi:hypothetical protein K450DRAFT_248759 [Umbelopsis ramanniana AG]|uniref:Uncharacterized protein n=1 Tax=Umbelopsis ramanniana AG TaxID=1314678 RepID=A0AAD5E826_UMBRA|nr:uncharacterized protein K450DRAFT_248759 [Umbelopsis ramanniana AG]KAI8578045.1 hypothetical protein K450DRAFT_248759 [Umbelopsis ramanniana AG]